MNSTQSFQELMDQVKSGSTEAVECLLEQYGDHIFRAVRRRLNRVIRSKYDSQDFVQAVWASFFAQRDEVSRFETPEDLVAFLSQVARNKVVDQCRHHMQTQKANVNRERSLSDPSQFSQDIRATQPTPSEVAIANEQFGRMIDGQPSHYQAIVALRAGGSTYGQIAAKLGVNEKTVRRVLKKLSTRLEG